jgi:DNA recombination protein RmuC
VVNRGLVEELQRNYRVNIAGPSTMAALLNSLQMGFRTFAIQKRSGEVWRVLGAVKTEFQKFSTVLSSSRKRLQQVDDDLEQLIGTRTRAITRNLRAVEQMDERETNIVLGALPEIEADEVDSTDE